MKQVNLPLDVARLMKKLLLLLVFIVLASCATTKTKVKRPLIITHTVLLNQHEYKYGYAVKRRFYKSNKLHVVGDTIQQEELDKMQIVKY